MFKMMKFIIFLSAFAIVLYFVTFVPLGDLTLYQHLGQISKTKEAKDLEGEIEKKIKQTATDIEEKIKKHAKELSKPAVAENDDEKKNAPKELKTGDSKLEQRQKDRPKAEELLGSSGEPNALDRQALNKLISRVK